MTITLATEAGLGPAGGGWDHPRDEQVRRRTQGVGERPDSNSAPMRRQRVAAPAHTRVAGGHGITGQHRPGGAAAERTRGRGEHAPAPGGPHA